MNIRVLNIVLGIFNFIINPRRDALDVSRLALHKHTSNDDRNQAFVRDFQCTVLQFCKEGEVKVFLGLEDAQFSIISNFFRCSDLCGNLR